MNLAVGWLKAWVVFMVVPFALAGSRVSGAPLKARCPRFTSVLWTLTWVQEHSSPASAPIPTTTQTSQSALEATPSASAYIASI